MACKTGRSTLNAAAARGAASSLDSLDDELSQARKALEDEEAMFAAETRADSELLCARPFMVRCEL